jgi:heme-degrading monooxygenase HmoA
MYARVARFAGLPPERIEVTVQGFKDGLLPEIEKLQGYKGVTVLVDRQGGAAVAMTFWETPQDMRASEELVAQAREQAIETARPEPRRDPLIDHYEVLLSRGEVAVG